jgi:ribosomal protein S14
MTEPVDPRISEARRMREEGVSNAEIAARFGVSKSTVCRWTVPGAIERERASSLAAKQRRRRPCPRCGGRVDITRAGELCRTCVDDDNREARMDRAVRCLQEWHALHGRVPTAPEWGAGGPGYRRVKTLASDGQPWPWYQHVSEDFGSWEAAVRAAGFQPRRPGVRADLEAWRGSLGYWSAHDIIRSILSWADMYGEPPANREWRRAGADHPSASTVFNRFGSWNAGIAAAGFRPREANGRGHRAQAA